MRHFRITVTLPRGGVLVGGHSEAPQGIDAAHAEHDGRPLLPATALRGALRETLEALLRGAGRPACANGGGSAPGEPHAEEGCALDDGEPCLACRLFGGERAAVRAGERGFSALVLGPALCERAASETDVIRHGVGISRQRRSARKGILFDRKLPAAPGLTFQAEGFLREASLAPYLEAATRGTTHLGAERSRGLGRVDLELQWLDAPRTLVPDLGPKDVVHLRVTLESNATFGVSLPDRNVRDTRREIPGSALRGAIGFALARRLEDPDGDAAFQALVAEDGARFGFLWPVADGEPGAPASPWPLTARACKNHGPAHGVVDTLLDRIAISLASTPAQAAAVEQTAPAACGHPGCDAPLRAAAGTRRAPTPPQTVSVTRVAMDRRRLGARHGALYTTVTLAEGAAFEGRIRGVPEKSRARLAEALSETLMLGRAQSAGRGRVRVEVVSPTQQEGLKGRMKAFETAIRGRLESAGLDPSRAGHLVAMTALSPLLPGADDDDGTRTVLDALGVEAEVVVKARRFAHEGGWDQRRGRMTPARAVVAGSVWVLALADPAARDALLATLRRLEADGVGERRHQGYGEVLFFDPFILERGAAAVGGSR